MHKDKYFSPAPCTSIPHLQDCQKKVYAEYDSLFPLKVGMINNCRQALLEAMDARGKATANSIHRHSC